jgi:hypothetical protein
VSAAAQHLGSDPGVHGRDGEAGVPALPYTTPVLEKFAVKARDHDEYIAMMRVGRVVIVGYEFATAPTLAVSLLTAVSWPPT